MALYLVDTLIDIGLRKGQRWPSLVHRQCAVNLLIGNPRVNGAEGVMKTVQWLLEQPKAKLRRLKLTDIPGEILQQIT